MVQYRLLYPYGYNKPLKNQEEIKMKVSTKMYTTVFNGATDAIWLIDDALSNEENFAEFKSLVVKAQERLKKAQIDAEELYLEMEDEDEPYGYAE